MLPVNWKGIQKSLLVLAPGVLSLSRLRLVNDTLETVLIKLIELESKELVIYSYDGVSDRVVYHK